MIKPFRCRGVLIIPLEYIVLVPSKCNFIFRPIILTGLLIELYPLLPNPRIFPCAFTYHLYRVLSSLTPPPDLLNAEMTSFSFSLTNHCPLPFLHRTLSLFHTLDLGPCRFPRNFFPFKPLESFATKRRVRLTSRVTSPCFSSPIFRGSDPAFYGFFVPMASWCLLPVTIFRRFGDLSLSFCHNHVFLQFLLSYPLPWWLVLVRASEG